MHRSDFAFAIITMGCAKNEVDSARMKQALLNAGYRFVEEPADADAILVNTCSFLQSATEESIGVIFEANDLPRVSDGTAKIAVCGCMPARYGEELADALTEVSCFVPCAEERDIVAKIDGLLGVLPDEAADDASQSQSEAFCAPLFELGSTSAYIKISDGCDRFCSFCAIPYIRGRYHSFTYEAICADVDDALAAGARELVLIAQDTGRWGTDLPGGHDLTWLVRSLAEAHPDTWIRVMYLEPEGITDGLLEVMATHDNVCSYLDIPLQHVSPAVLKPMNRKGNAEEFLALLERIRAAVPDVTLRTTLIAGFPGETEEDLDELCDFLEDAAFDYVGVFPFSAEEGTRAYELPGRIPDEECFERAQRIRDLADGISAPLIAERVGKVVPVLVEGWEEDGQLVGRTQAQAPEVDGETYVDAGEPGDVVMARIVDTMMYEMEAEVLK